MCKSSDIKRVKKKKKYKNPTFVKRLTTRQVILELSFFKNNWWIFLVKTLEWYFKCIMHLCIVNVSVCVYETLYTTWNSNKIHNVMHMSITEILDDNSVIILLQYRRIDSSFNYCNYWKSYAGKRIKKKVKASNAPWWIVQNGFSDFVMKPLCLL